MKKVFGIFIPVLIILLILGLFLLAYSSGRKGFGCSLDKEQGANSGMQYFQPLIDKIEDYKVKNGRYPKNLEQIEQNIIGNGQKFPNEKITGASVNLNSEENYFTITFFFDNDYVCLLGQARKCSYQSSIYWSGKDNKGGKWQCE